MWEIDPVDGVATEMARRPPLLWSPDGRQRIVVSDDGATSTVTRVDMDGNERASVTVEGLVSHVRWSPESDRVVFTLGRSAPSGGVLQDLFLWDLGEEAPTQITATGAAFGAEWMGSRVRWREDPG
jgi:Tol biopolymer transport system component